ncbi:hypothetical protein C7458_105335 [Williamsia muralis]|nr:hypothetical protein C7458_105335 [Williamsia marianensis]
MPQETGHNASQPTRMLSSVRAITSADVGKFVECFDWGQLYDAEIVSVQAGSAGSDRALSVTVRHRGPLGWDEEPETYELPLDSELWLIDVRKTNPGNGDSSERGYGSQWRGQTRESLSRTAGCA